MKQRDFKDEAFNRVIGFAISALPDSLKKRQQILRDVLEVLPHKHPQRIEVASMLVMLEAHEEKQISLPLVFAKEAAK